jgi:multimeric flavodoxin WrbA
MKILALSGSMRKKNTNGIIKLIEEKVDINDNFENIFLSDYNIEYCKCCGVCTNNDINSCPNNDDFSIIFNKIIECDVLILSSPVYVCNVSGILKNFIDRSFQLYFKPFLYDKKVIIVATSSYNGLKNSLKYLSFVVKSWGLNLIGEIGVNMDKYRNSYKYNNKILRKIEIIISKIKFDKNHIKLKDLIMFNDQKKNIIKNKKQLIKSYEYWRDNKLLVNKFFIKININPLKSILAKIINVDMTRN